MTESINRLEDRWLPTTTAGHNGQAEDSTGAVMSPTLGGGATFTSRAYPHSFVQPGIQVFFYGSQVATVYVEESNDNFTTVHRQHSCITRTNNSNQIADFYVRVICSQYRLKVVNAGVAQVGARLWGRTTSWDTKLITSPTVAGSDWLPPMETMRAVLNLSDGSFGSVPLVYSTQQDAFPNSVKTLPVLDFNLVYNGASWDMLRTPKIFKTVSLASATAETTIWTPAGGKKFRLMGFNLTCTTAASVLTFKDNTAGTTIFIAEIGAAPFSPSGLGNGILSAAANNVLTVTRGTATTLNGTVWGTEE